MDIVQKADFTYYVDVTKTKEYYLSNSLCDCPGCRNLSAQIKEFSPQLNSFLSEFGVDICRPDESADIEMEDYIDYLFIGYTVTGWFEPDGVYETDVGNVHVTISRGDTPYDWFPNEQKQPCFYISISGVSLPWVLDEPFPKSEGLVDKLKRLFRQ